MNQKTHTNRLIKSALLSVLLVQTVLLSSAHAEIFKCTNKEGKVFYNDKPCPSLDDEKKMRSEKDVVNGYVPPVLKEGKKQPNKMDNQTLRKSIESPKQTNKKKKSKADSSSGSQRLTGGSGGRKGSRRIAERGDALSKTKTEPPKGNYAEREKTVEDIRIYLGIKRNFE